LGPLPIGVGDVLYRPLMSEAVDDGEGDASLKSLGNRRQIVKIGTSSPTLPLLGKGEKSSFDASTAWPTSDTTPAAPSGTGDVGTALKNLDSSSAWKAFEQIARRWEGQFKRAAAALFEAEELAIEGTINGMKGKSIKAIDYIGIMKAVLGYLGVEAVKKWATAYTPLMMGLMQAQLTAWTDAVGIDWDIESPAVTAYIKDHAYMFAERISETTVEEIRSLFLAAHDEGWSVVRMIEEVQAVYGGWSDLRAEMIARSETIRSSNAGLVEGYRQNGISRIEWFAALDERLCPFCGEMHGEQIPMGEAWFANGSEMQVGDEHLVMDYGDVYWPPLHPNCRCVMQPVFAES
jgi:SPP1 gp7 family putative phage head morphogenesis protein